VLLLPFVAFYFILQGGFDRRGQTAWGVIDFLVESGGKSLKATAELADDLRLRDVGDEKAMPGAGDSHIDEVSHLPPRPAVRLDLVEADEEDEGVVEPLGAVDREDCDAFGGDVLPSLGAVVLRHPGRHEPPGLQGPVPEPHQPHAKVPDGFRFWVARASICR
jgi:hypothetical protein